ncbi:hypothetical protein [Paracoccus cavernae]|uniref:hypothetical protein n=1 Tax=Paracoccus cavernae TaxID=1571207 RepID=UPI00362C015E
MRFADDLVDAARAVDVAKLRQAVHESGKARAACGLRFMAEADGAAAFAVFVEDQRRQVFHVQTFDRGSHPRRDHDALVGDGVTGAGTLPAVPPKTADRDIGRDHQKRQAPKPEEKRRIRDPDPDIPQNRESGPEDAEWHEKLVSFGQADAGRRAAFPQKALAFAQDVAEVEHADPM